MKKLIFILPLIVFMCGCSNENVRKIDSDLMELIVEEEVQSKEIKIKCRVKNGSKSETFIINNSLLNCSRRAGQKPVVKKKNGGIEIIRELVSDSINKSCRLTERFTFNKDGSIHCKFLNKGIDDDIWDTSIESKLYYHNRATFWTARAAPNFDEKNVDEELLHTIMLHDYDKTRGTYHGWRDPLVSVPFCDMVYYYGAPAFEDNNSRAGFIPFQENLFSVPIATFIDAEADKGISLVLSPADDIFDMTLETTADGSITFKRFFNRICKRNIIVLNYDIVLHENDWRSGLAWMRDNYKEYFYPKNMRAFELDGTGAYSESNFYDVEMCYGTSEKDIKIVLCIN